MTELIQLMIELIQLMIRLKVSNLLIESFLFFLWWNLLSLLLLISSSCSSHHNCDCTLDCYSSDAPTSPGSGLVTWCYCIKFTHLVPTLWNWKHEEGKSIESHTQRMDRTGSLELDQKNWIKSVDSMRMEEEEEILEYWICSRVRGLQLNHFLCVYRFLLSSSFFSLLPSSLFFLLLSGWVKILMMREGWELEERMHRVREYRIQWKRESSVF